MAIIKIKEAINNYNSNLDRGESKMTQKSLSAHVLRDCNIKLAEHYLSRWCNDEALTKMTPSHIMAICDKCKVTPNFLFGWDETEIY